MEPRPAPPRARRRLLVALAVLVLQAGPGPAGEVKLAARTSPGAVPAVAAGVARALDLQLRALRPSLGSAPAMAHALLREARPDPRPGEADPDSLAAALILKRALTEPEAWTQARLVLSAQPDPATRALAEALAELRESIQADPGSSRAFQEAFAPLEESLAAGGTKDALDELFAGAASRPDLAASGSPSATVAPGRGEKAPAPLARPDARRPPPSGVLPPSPKDAPSASDEPETALAPVPAALLTPEEVLGDPGPARRHYESLKSRFKNGNLDEVLFLDRPEARGPRLSPEDHGRMLETLRRFLNKHPEETRRLGQTPALRPFRLGGDGSVEELSPELERSWRRIGPELSRLGERVIRLGFLDDYDADSSRKVLGDLAAELGVLPGQARQAVDLARRAHQEALIRALVKQFNRDRSPATLRAIADALIAFQAPPSRLARLRMPELGGFSQYLLLEEIEKQAARAGRRLGVPGKATDALLSRSSLQGVERSSFLRKGTVILPMSRWEAVFKGVGTGECVRTACNRYFDAFFDDSAHLKILKDGQETGFIGVYKTAQERTGRKYWFLETIQSPFLGGASPGKGPLRGLLLHLQQLAVLDDSMLALPARTFNSYNFKEVTAELETIPETKTGLSVKVALRSPRRLARLRGFNSSDLSEFDQLVAKTNGYEPTLLTNGLVFNDGEAAPIAPLLEQPDWYLQRAHDLLSGKRPLSPPDRSLRLEPLRRARLLDDLAPGSAVKRRLFALRRELLASGRDKDAASLTRKIYRALPESLHDRPFREQLRYVAKRVATVEQSAQQAQELKDELLLKASSWKDYASIVALGDKDGDAEEDEGGEIRTTPFAAFLLSTLGRFADQAAPAELLELYRENLPYMPDDQSSLELTRLVGARLKTPEEFLQLVKLALGETGSGQFDDDDMRDLYVAENWERFFPARAAPRRRRGFAEQLLNRVQIRADLHIRQGLLLRAESFKEMASYLKLSSLTGHLDVGGRRILSKIVSDAMTGLTERTPLEGLLGRDMDARLCEAYLTPADMDRVKLALAGKAGSPGELDRLAASGRLSPRDLLSASPLLSGHVRGLVEARPLDESFFLLLRMDLKSVLSLSLSGERRKAAIADIHESAARARLRDYLAWRRLLQSDRILAAGDARSLDAYLRVVRELPPARQEKVLEKLGEAGPVLLTDAIPEHAALLATLHGWAADLDARGLRRQARALAGGFSVARVRRDASAAGKPAGWLSRHLKERLERLD